MIIPPADVVLPVEGYRNPAEKVLDTGMDGLTPSAAIKAYLSEAATDVAMDAVQLLGSNEVQITHVAKGLLQA